MTTTTESLTGLSASQLRARFDTAGGSAPIYVIDGVASVVRLVQFQVGIRYAANAIGDLENMVSSAEALSTDQSDLISQIASWAGGYGLKDESTVEYLVGEVSHYGSESTSRVRARIVEQLFLSDEPTRNGRLYELAARNQTDWGLRHLEYRNPLEIIFGGVTALVYGAYKLAKHSLELWKAVQDGKLAAVELEKKKVGLTREKVGLESDRAALSGSAAANALAWETARKAWYESEQAALNYENAWRVAQMRAREGFVAPQVPGSSVRNALEAGAMATFARDHLAADTEVNLMNAVVRRSANADPNSIESSARLIPQAAIEVTFQISLPHNLPAIVEQGNLIASLPRITDTDLTTQ